MEDNIHIKKYSQECQIAVIMQQKIKVRVLSFLSRPVLSHLLNHFLSFPANLFIKMEWTLRWFINHLSVHSIKKNTDLTHVQYLNKSSRLQNIQQKPSDRQTEELCTSDWCGWRRGRRKTDRGEWHSSQMNDRLQMFGFARQRLHWLLCLLVWSTQAATFGHDRKKMKRRRRKIFDKEWGSKGFIPPTVAYIWLNF